jgi:hypothetical protein
MNHCDTFISGGTEVNILKYDGKNKLLYGTSMELVLGRNWVVLRVQIIDSVTLNIYMQNILRFEYWNQVTPGIRAFPEKPPVASYSRTFQYFIVLESLLQCLQDAATGRYPEPDESSLHYPILFL